MKKRIIWAALALALSSAAQAAPVIVQMHTATFGGYWQDFYAQNGQFMVVSNASHYVLSDGSQWHAGGGWHPDTFASVAASTIAGGTVRYTFKPLVDNILFQNADYNGGKHTAQGTLTVDGALVMTAALGAQTGLISGYATLKSNDDFGQPDFSFYDAKRGDKVYFEQRFTLANRSFTADLFHTDFTYNLTGVVDFTRKAPAEVPEPGGSLLFLGALAAAALVRRQR